MGPNKTYILCGYITPLEMEEGFVTPVFYSQGSMFLQVTTDNRCIDEFIKMPDQYASFYFASHGETVQKEEGDECLFALKTHSLVSYKEHKEMVPFIRQHFYAKDTAAYLSDNFLDFIVDPQIDDDNKPITQNKRLQEKIWQGCVKILHEREPEISNIWISLFNPETFDDDTLNIRCSSSIAGSFFTRYLTPLLSREIERKFEQLIYFKIDEAPLVKEDESIINVLRQFEIPKLYVSHNKLETVFKRDVLKYTSNDYYTFPQLLITSHNYQALQICDRVAEHPQSIKNKLLVILGDHGSGKSHLLHALGNALGKSEKEKVLTINAFELKKLVTKAALHNKMDDLFAFNFCWDYVLLDDGHYLDDDEALWAPLKYLTDHGKGVIMTYRKKEKEKDEEQLPAIFSRINRVIISHLSLPDRDERKKILQKKCYELNIHPVYEPWADEIASDTNYHLANIETNLTYFILSVGWGVGISADEWVIKKKKAFKKPFNFIKQEVLYHDILQHVLCKFNAKAFDDAIKDKEKIITRVGYIVLFLYDLWHRPEKENYESRAKLFPGYEDYSKKYAFKRTLAVILAHKRLFTAVKEIFEKQLPPLT